MKRTVWIFLALVSGWAAAHPVDEVVQGAYLTLTPGKILLELDLTPGVQVAGTMVKGLDANADGRVTDAEGKAYAVRVLGQSTLKVNGVAIRWSLDSINVPPLQDLKTGNAVLTIYAVARRPDQVGAQTLDYQNRYQPAKSQWTANIFLQPTAGWKYQVNGQARSNDGRQLTVKYSATRS